MIKGMVPIHALVNLFVCCWVGGLGACERFHSWQIRGMAGTSAIHIAVSPLVQFKRIIVYQNAYLHVVSLRTV